MQFPEKLWKLINECQSGAIKWSINGQTILINYKLFEEEYLRGGQSPFTTKNIKSFIRQLNLYNFKKIAGRVSESEFVNNSKRTIHEFENEFFKRGRMDLLVFVIRKKYLQIVNKSCPNHSRKNVTVVTPMCDIIFSEPTNRLIRARNVLRIALQRAYRQEKRIYPIEFQFSNEEIKAPKKCHKQNELEEPFHHSKPSCVQTFTDHEEVIIEFSDEMEEQEIVYSLEVNNLCNETGADWESFYLVPLPES